MTYQDQLSVDGLVRPLPATGLVQQELGDCIPSMTFDDNSVSMSNKRLRKSSDTVGSLHQNKRLRVTWMKSTRHRQRYKMKRATNRLRLRIKNIVDEVHKKSVSWLTNHYSTIVIPKFGVSQMVMKIDSRGKQRRIRRKTVRAMLTWSHYRFRHRLIYKSRVTNTHVVVCDEVYTSKTCGCCGHIHAKLGSSKLFKCPTCNFTIDRDLNGARNILLRYLTLQNKNSI